MTRDEALIRASIKAATTTEPNQENIMTTVFESSPKFSGISCVYARVTTIKDRVLIRAIDVISEEAVTIAMTPDQARSLAAGIVAAADNAEAHQ